eukprot:3932898-Rhodomonas_salina.1
MLYPGAEPVGIPMSYPPGTRVPLGSRGRIGNRVCSSLGCSALYPGMPIGALCLAAGYPRE